MELAHPVASFCGRVNTEVTHGFFSSRVTETFKKYEALRNAYLEQVEACVQSGGNVDELKPNYSDLMYGM